MYEKNNYQDAAEEREYRKGEAAGANRAARRKASKGKKARNNDRQRGAARNKGNRNSAGVNSPNKRQDFEWYNYYSQLVDDVVRFDFARPTGNNIAGLNHIRKTYDGVNLPNTSLALPGLMTVRLAPSVGYSIDPQSAISKAARQLFSYLRQSRSGTAPYELTDVMMVFNSVADAYSYVNFLIRAYAEAMQFSVYNQYLPLALIQSDGIDPEDLIKNRAEFRKQINFLIADLAQFKIPASMSLMKRRAFLYANVYQEGVSIRDQMYKYVPAGFSFLVDGTEENPATSVQVKPLPKALSGYKGATVEQLIAYGREMLYNLSNATSDTFAYIQADILNTFGASEGAYVQLAFVPDEVVLPIEMNLNVLYQIKNAKPILIPNLFNEDEFLKTLAITQTTAVGYTYPISAPQMVVNTEPSSAVKAAILIASQLPTYVDVPTAEPTAEQIMEFTRLCPVLSIYQDVADPDAWGLTVDGGSEIPLSMNIWRIDPASGELSGSPVGTLVNITEGSTTLANLAYSEYLVKNFDYAPNITRYAVSSSGEIAPLYFSWDFDNYAAIHASDMEDVNRTALYSEFAVAGVMTQR